jgi:two-component system, NarL family, invasion response regulator UvrY
MASIAVGSNSPEKQPGSRNKLRAIVVDDSLTILHAICSLLEHHEIVDVVGRAESGSETIDAVLNLHPDLVLMDADMPGMSGLRASLLLSQISPATRVVLMSMDTTPQFRNACCGCGACGLIYKPKFLSELAQLLEGRPQQWHETFPRPRRKTTRAVTYNEVTG